MPRRRRHRFRRQPATTPCRVWRDAVSSWLVAARWQIHCRRHFVIVVEWHCCSFPFRRCSLLPSVVDQIQIPPIFSWMAHVVAVAAHCPLPTPQHTRSWSHPFARNSVHGNGAWPERNSLPTRTLHFATLVPTATSIRCWCWRRPPRWTSTRTGRTPTWPSRPSRRIPRGTGRGARWGGTGQGLLASLPPWLLMRYLFCPSTARAASACHS
mmetsp:Transcript_28041/g.78651  ORF Transcript_28041/g.78651 Transcript_28041/m.78651 type:complete len:211 (+) Transcript_28041:622-1254(+)